MSVRRQSNRREFLQAGALAFGGLTLPEILAAQQAAGVTSDTSVILLYLHGGPSQLETWDLKPDAPVEYRSQFLPIETAVPGMTICEHFPRQARIADKFSVIRSLHHDVNIHSDGGIVVLTGKRPEQLDPASQSKSKHPDVGSIASRMRSSAVTAVPPYVAIPRKPYMTQPAYLGLHHGAFEIGDPGAKDFRPTHLSLAAGRDGEFLNDRLRLLSGLDRLRRDLDSTGNLAAADQFRQRAVDLLTSPDAAAAFDLSREPEELRDRYGRHLWGQSCLLAWRLAEAGTAVITLYVDTPVSDPDYTNWDDHPGNAGRPGHFATFMQRRLPYLDQALATLIEDVFDRGLDRRILIVAVGEFGRTPRMRFGPPDNSFGRDHWPDAYSALISGGGLNMGQVIGATNSRAEFPTENPLTPQDLLATVYRHLGIDIHTMLTDHSGRPVPILSEGRPIAQPG